MLLSLSCTILNNNNNNSTYCYLASGILVVVLSILVALFMDAFDRLNGNKKKGNSLSRRERQDGQSYDDWLLGDNNIVSTSKRRIQQMHQPTTSGGGNKLRVSIENSPAEPTEWIIGHDTVPPLNIKGWSSLYGILPSFLLPKNDIVIRPPSTRIPGATCEEVWRVLLDFDQYPNWNGFHRKMEILDLPSSVERFWHQSRLFD